MTRQCPRHHRFLTLARLQPLTEHFAEPELPRHRSRSQKRCVHDLPRLCGTCCSNQLASRAVPSHATTAGELPSPKPPPFFLPMAFPPELSLRATVYHHRREATTLQPALSLIVVSSYSKTPSCSAPVTPTSAICQERQLPDLADPSRTTAAVPRPPATMPGLQRAVASRSWLEASNS
jgi:hypothetical protein